VKWLEGGATINVIFLVLAIAGILSSIYFYIRSRRERRLVFHVRTFPLIRKSIGTVPELSIAYRGKPVTTLSLTRLALWNAGSQTITKADIVASEPLRVRAEGEGEILAAQVSFTRRPAAHLAANLDAMSILLSFDFLDQSDGGILDIYHSGTLKFDVVGNILGHLPDPDKFKYFSLLFFMLYMPILIFAIAPLFLSLLYSKIFKKIPLEYSLE
jgi:hypothetical protein